MSQWVSDCSTWLATAPRPWRRCLAGRRLAMLEWTGLFDSRFNQQGLDTALYMSRPYEPGKIPVIFVHGLVSSPRLGEDDQRTGEHAEDRLAVSVLGVSLSNRAADSLVGSSPARIARAGAKRGRPVAQRPCLRPHRTGRPQHGRGAFQDDGSRTGTMLWNAAITVPLDRFRAPPDLRGSLEKLLVFEPVPYVSRLIFIATPHRGSPIADGPIGWAVSGLMRRPMEQAERIAEIERLNGPNVLTRELRTSPLNSISSLRTDSPILAALDKIPINPSVPYHSIIPLLMRDADTDGVVDYVSSHLEGAESEKIVAGDHSSQETPEVTSEIKRILLEHLGAETTAATAGGAATPGLAGRRLAP